ncbi:pericentrin isoform X3 [Amphiprion ocellaris]|uniref:pericentrin isoform X3 n=1 Tax=Amphiprion ocellaris TaxID=80972 RepID=UPI00241114C5|nr:pericentrin isoform X3 [Amphiprion ocellaris]
MDEDERRRKLEAGKAKKSISMPRSHSLASYRQKRAKSNGVGATKKTQKRKGQTVTQNDSSPQDPNVEPALPSTSATELNSKANHEETEKSEKSEVQQNEGQKDEPPTREQSPSPVEDLKEEELAALTGKEQLQQLQQAVEKRNEIIAKLSSNLQEALASRDQVQLEAQSLAVQIQALQRQLQQTSVEFLRIKSQSGPEVLNVPRQQWHGHGDGDGHSSQDANINQKETPSEGSGDASPGPQSGAEDFSTGSDSETETILHKLRAELEEEKKKNQRICAELAEEMEKNQRVLSLLEKEKQKNEEERKDREAQLQNVQTQLSQVQTQCLELQQYKEEKEKLNREVLELKKRLQEEEDSERRFSEEVASFNLRLQNLEGEKLRQEEEMKRLKEEHREEVEQVRQLLDEREKELKFREEEVIGLKASKNRQNQAKAGFSCADRISIEEPNLESGPDLDNVNTSDPGDILMERYLSSVPIARSQSSLVNESFEQHSQLDISADLSFELNSEVFGDQPLLSISNRPPEEHDSLQNTSDSQHFVPVAEDSHPQSLCQLLHNSACGELEMSKMSEQYFEETDLEKELLNQQCGELREELVLKDRDLNVLREEVIKSAEELEEARSRWAQVTEELKEALWELEEEKEKRRHVEEEMNLKANEQDNLKNKLGALLEEREKENVVMLTDEEAEITTETSLLVPATLSSEEEDKVVGELKKEQEKKAVLSSHQKQQELLVSSLQEIKQTAVSVKESPKRDESQLQKLQADCELLMSELEETKMEHKTTTTLLNERTMELDTVLKELETTRVQILNVQTEVERLQKELRNSQDGFDFAEKEKNELESQISCLRQNLACLEEVQVQSVQEREEHRRKEEEMDEQIKKMEQVLEEELEQFENMLKAKDVEMAEEKEKWEEERQEKAKEFHDVTHLLKKKEEEVKALMEKQELALKEATEKLTASYQQEIKNLIEKHEQEISESNTHLETELLKQQASMEEEQKRQISLIKQVTEREHERMVSALNAKHSEEISQLRTEVTLELRESMEAAHQAELQQAQAQKTVELEALRLSLSTVHLSQLEHSQVNLQQEQESALIKVQASMRETFAQESALLQARHQSQLNQLKQQNQEQQERLREVHQQDMDELKKEWETRVAQEGASMEEKQAKEVQVLRAQWEKEVETTQANFQTSLSEIQNNVTATQTELSSTQDSLRETNKALTEAQAALSQTLSELQGTQARLEELQTSSKEQTQKLEEELKQAWADRDAAACSLEELISSHKRVLQEKEQQALLLEEKEQQLQQEVLHLQEEKTLLRKSSEEEVGQLWTQLESMRTSRQELGAELKEQLLARSSRVDDIECLKKEFNEQKREIKEQNEAELENLRRYFEKRLRATEESHKEEIALLQLRLVESALEESVLKTTDDNAMSQGQAEKEKDVLSDTDKPEKQKEMLDILRLQLEEKHTMDLSDLQSSLTLSFKEELQQVRSDLTDHYYEELQEMKTRHAMDLEQLRAKLSDSHLRELTEVHLEAARQVESEVEQRIWCHSEELQTRMTIIHTLENRLAALSQQHDAEMQKSMQKLKQEFAVELAHLEEALKQEREHVQESMKRLREELQEKHETEIAALKSHLDKEMQDKTYFEKALHEEKDKSKSLQAALDNNENPQHILVRQWLEAPYDSELQEAKSCMSSEIKEVTVLLQEQSEERLHQAQERFQEEKAALEQHLVQQYEESAAELKNKLEAELEHERATLLTKHSQEMDTLDAKHKAQLESLGASHRDQLAAMAAELESKHNAELVALEAALSSKRKEDLEGLEAVLQETSQAQLEALEAELSRRHQEERDQLEKRMLGNMDTLEATYLKEVQMLRDQMVQLEDRHREDLNCQNSEHKELMERHTAEQLSIREDLRKELAQVHMEKFRAMATELSHVHKSELAAQKEALDTEHCNALETLKKQVLELELQHSTALQELSRSFTDEKEQLIEQHQLQLQELRGVSARELEACRRELEEESSRQRQHFLEEVELLKVQSEERLQDRINQLKTEFEEQKEAELEELRRSFTSEQEEKEQSYTGKMSQLTAQLQQLDAVVAQLRAEVGCLQGELEGKRAEMETLDTLLQRRERESQEGGNLLKMLTDDLQTAKEEKRNLHNANEKLKKVLIEMLRSIIATEELIGQKLSARTKTSEPTAHQRSSVGNKDAQESGISVADLSSEELELTHQLCESLLVSDTQISPGGEEAALNSCGRLRQTVDALLELLNRANSQLEQTHNVHQSLEEKLSQGREDSAQLLEQHKLLLEQLDQEAKMKSQLQLELHKAEGLLEGYVAEKAVLEESLQQKETQEERLVEELEDLKLKLQQMQSLTTELDSLRVKHQELSEEHTLVLRQKEHLSAGLGEREKALLGETERLNQDRLDLQRQAEKSHKSLSMRLRTLERELEEQETKGLETELHHKTHTEDLNQRVQALEKQLKHDRQFIEEQAVEREHERDEFQQEIRRLEAQVRQTANVDNKGHRVESLQAIIKDKTEDHASLLAANQQAQRDLTERNEEIDKLTGRIRELEQALLNSAESNGSVSHLEQELHRAKLREQELTQDKQALEQQQLSNRLQISALQSKLDETRHGYHDNMHDPTQELRNALDTAQQTLQSKEQEIEVLFGQLENVQRDLSIKEVELKHLTLQLELLTNKNAEHVNELQEQIAALMENVSALTIIKEEKEGCSEVEETEEETFTSALLQEKNQEIDHLNSEIQKLEQELENARDNKALEVELEDLHSQVEHLQSEITRVRQDKQEEEERLHEVISTLQAELATLGPNLHEVSDSQDGDSINPSPAPSPEPHHYAIQEEERRGGPNSLKHELSLTHSASSRSLRSRLKALQSQLDTAVAEKEGLERLLLTQEEEYRGQGEEFGKRLKAEREKCDELKGFLILKEVELEEVKAQAEEERKNSKQSESDRDSLKVKDEEANALLKEKAHLNSLVLELQKNEEERAGNLEALKTKEQEMKIEMEVLRETSLTLERQVQEVRAEVLDMEELVAEERTKIKTLETVKGELSAEREALRKREGQLQEEIERLRQEGTSMRAVIQDLTVKLNEKETSQEEAQKEVLTHAEATLAKADATLREKEAELTRLKAEQQALRAELTAVKQGLSTTTERAEKLHEEGQTKDRALTDLETDNQRLNAELRTLQEDLAIQEEELAYQQRELQQLRQQCHQDTLPHHQKYPQKDISQRVFEDAVTVSRDEASLSSPEVLRRLECSEDRIPERFHNSILGSRLSELSGLNSTGLDLPQVKLSPRVIMEPPHSRTITPDPATQSTHSPGSLSVSDNFSVLDSLDADKVRDLEELDLTTPPSPLGSTSSLSAPEWASDGYGSNVSSELGARLRVELEQTERLDAQFIEYLRCRGMNPTVNTDSAAGSMSYSDDLLSPELQGLLKKVYQESCRILTLSQRRATPSTQPHVLDLKALSVSQTQHHSEDSAAPLDHRDKSLSNPPMSWQQEKRALQETVIALRELLCRMAQRHTQTDYRGEDNWQRDQLQIDGRVESQLRAELEESKKQVKCAHDTQQEQKNKILSLRLTVEEGEEALRREQARIQELQQELEQERALKLRKDIEEEDRREAVQVSTEQQRSEVMCLKGQVEQEKVACSNLRRELQIEQSRSGLLEKRLEDTQKELEDEHKRSAHQQELSLQEKTRLERLLTEAESRLAEIHSKLADSYRKLDEERDRGSRQVDELSRRHEADAARDRKFISDLRSQLEQERRQGEELAAVTDKLRAELLQSRRKWEDEDRTRREELQREQEAATRHRVAVETLKEQKQEASRALEVERERSRRQGMELTELKERLRLLKDKEREREEQWERERRKGRQEQMERERRHERTKSKLCDLELLRQQDQQRMQELQRTLAELEREERQMAAERMSGQATGQQHEATSSHRHSHLQTDGAQAGVSQMQQMASTSSSNLLETLLKENSELTQRVTSLSQERATFKHRLTCLERQLRTTENELAKVTSETENRPINDVTNSSKLQRLYERYLRAESFRKALVYQKRYLLLLIGGFQECEQATLCLIAHMGARPSPPLSSQRRPFGRFRAVVRVVIAVSRMKFLTRKWQKAIRRLSLSGTVNGHAPGPKAEVLRQQQQPRSNPSSPQTRDSHAVHRETVSSLVPPSKSPFRLHNRSYSSTTLASVHSAGTSLDPERSLTEYIHHLEKVQQRLAGARQGPSALQPDPK